MVTGKLVLDDGAVRVVCEAGKSLLPVGVKEVLGDFKRGAIVACIDGSGREVARGLVNYSSKEVEKVKGRPSAEIQALLGYVDEPELIHRNNLVLMG